MVVWCGVWEGRAIGIDFWIYIPMQARNGPWARSRDPSLQRVACSGINSAKSSDVPPQIDSGLRVALGARLIITQTLVRSAVRRCLACANAAPADAPCLATAAIWKRALRRRDNEPRKFRPRLGRLRRRTPPQDTFEKGAAPARSMLKSLHTWLGSASPTPNSAGIHAERGAGSRVGMIGFRRLR